MGYLEDSLCVGRDGGVERRPAHVVLDVGISTGLQQAFGRVRARVPGSQVQGGLARAVSLVVQAGALVDEVRDDGGSIVLLLAVAGLQPSSAARGDHQGGEAVWKHRGAR